MHNQIAHWAQHVLGLTHSLCFLHSDRSNACALVAVLQSHMIVLHSDAVDWSWCKV